MGRPSKYHTNVKPYLEKIEEMALTMTEEQIAKTLRVSYSAFREYKEKYPALQDSLKRGRQELVLELKSTLIKKAKGYQYQEKKVIKENGEVVREEINTKTCTPDVAAIHLLLKNLDDSWRNDDKETMSLKKKQINLTEEKIKQNEW